MPLSRDPNILKIPAFMRTRKINTAQAKRPLVLTALDRKNAGVPAPGLPKKRRTPAQLVREAYAQSALEFEKPKPQRRKSLVATLTERRLTEVIGEKAREARANKVRERKSSLPRINVENAFSSRPRISKFSAPIEPVEKFELVEESESDNIFSAPLIDDSPPSKSHATHKSGTGQKIIGEMTHYFEKIHVGVILLSGVLCVGDCITYKTEDGEMYEQVVESMEIDREPVFRAGKGSEVGIKLNSNPRVGCDVYTT